MTPQFHDYAERPLICRADKDPLVLSFLFLLVVLIFLWAAWTGPRPLSRGDVWFLIAGCAGFGSISAGLAWAVIHRRAVMTVEGLTVIGFLTTRFFPWRDIEDYELRPALHWQEKAGLPIAMLRVRGRWYPIHSAFVPREALLERITRETKWSQAREWQFKDLRDESDWPKTFTYPPDSIGRRIGTYTLLFLWLTVPQAGLLLAFHNSHSVMQGSDFSASDRHALVATVLAVQASFILLALANTPVSRVRKGFGGQKIEASIEGLRYFRDGQVEEITWSEIKSYDSKPLKGFFLQSQSCFYVVELPRLRIEFFSGIRGEERLKTLIQNRAKNAAMKDWPYYSNAGRLN